MQIIGITPAIGLLVLGGWNGVKGSGTIKEEARNVGEFSAVQIESGFHATIALGSTSSVKISTDDNLLPLIKTEVKGGELIVGPADWKQHPRPSSEVKVTITTPKLEKIEASGGSSVAANGTTGARFQASTSGGSVVKVSGLNADQVSVGASGGSKIDLAGRAKAVKVELSGGASLHATEVPAESVQVEGSGGSRAEVSVSAALDASLSGGSRVRVNGDPPKRNVQKSGGSEVIFASR